MFKQKRLKLFLHFDVLILKIMLHQRKCLLSSETIINTNRPAEKGNEKQMWIKMILKKLKRLF